MMRQRVVVANWMKPTRLKGLTLYPWIFVRPELRNDAVLLNHERIHWEQQRELTLPVFLALYGLNFLFNVARFAGMVTLAYRAIVFEREAKENEGDSYYLARRERYAYIRKRYSI
jgi:hypothetical protein